MENVNYKKRFGLKYNPSRFFNPYLAFNHSANTVKPSRVILGCDDRFWVVCPADAARLEKIGFEYAE